MKMPVTMIKRIIYFLLSWMWNFEEDHFIRRMDKKRNNLK